MKHKFLWVIFIIIAGLAIFIFGSGNPYKINLITAAILAATLVSILWYTVETHKLRTNYEKGAEIESFPWLTGSDLKVNKNETIENFIWSDTIYLPIKNVGKTPAFDTKIQTNINAQEPDILEKKEYQDIIIAPGDTYHFKLGQLNYHNPTEDVAQIDVTLTYKSYLGGKGKSTQNFVYRNKSWANGPSTYQFILSDGRTYPKNNEPEKNSVIPKLMP